MSHSSVDLLAIGDRIVSRATELGASVAEASIREGSHLSTKVRMRERELVEEAGSRSLGLRVMVGQQVAVTYTSDFSESGQLRLVEDALELAKLSQPDEFAGPPDASLLSAKEEHTDLRTVDSAMEEADAAFALERALSAEAAALDYDGRITNSEGATFVRGRGRSALVTSGGFRGENAGTFASVSVQPVAEDPDGKKQTGSHWAARRHLAELEGSSAVGEEAARRTLRKLGAKKIASEEMPVVFDPDAARSILGLLASCIMGSSIWRRRSYLLDRIDTEVASSAVTIIDDPLIPKALGSRPYDGEGLLSRTNVVVEKGVLKTYLLDSYCARKLNMKSTASASRGSSGGVGPSTTNFALQPGNMSQEELIASTPRGLYVTSMMGFGFNAVSGDFSRGAAGFMIENGELTFPVNEVTISLNLDEILKRIDAVADDLDLRTATASPTFRVSQMTVAGT